MQDHLASHTAQLRQKDALLRSVEGQRNEALTSAARASANVELVMEALQNAQKDLETANAKIAGLEKAASERGEAEGAEHNGAANGASETHVQP